MNTENLNTQELETLRTLLNKMAGEPQTKIYIDPVNKMIDNIMDEFNFATVHKTMVALDWKWVVTSNNKVPTMDELRTEAERLLRDAADVRLDMWQYEHWILYSPA